MSHVRKIFLTSIAFCTFSAIASMPGCGGKSEVQVVSPRRGEIVESFREPARTRLDNIYPITMPVSGRIGRIQLEPGDTVSKGQELVEFDRRPLKLKVEEFAAAVKELEAQIGVQDDNRLEETAKIETKVTIDAFEETLKAADAQIEAEQARANRAGKELVRTSQLFEEKAIPQNQLDDAQLASETALIELRKQQFNKAALNAFYIAVRLGPRYIEEWLGRKSLKRKVFVQQLAQTKARLASVEHQLSLASITSPIDGVVLKREEEGDGTFNAGHPLLQLGNLAELEIIAEVLTQDALRLSKGSEVHLEPAVGLETLQARVKRIEPAGFTKLSSLGVEQQRVYAILDFKQPPQNLGVGYRVQARFITGRKADALIVPRFSVLQESMSIAAANSASTSNPNPGAYYVLKVEKGQLKKQPVVLGLRSDLELEVLEGLTAKDQIVAAPDSKMQVGDKVAISK